MNSAESERLETAHRLLRDLRSREFREATAEATASGVHVIVTALPDDTMADLFGHLHAARGPIHVAVRSAAGYFLLSMEPHEAPRHARVKRSADDECGITFGTHVGMVIDYLRMRNRPVYLYEAEPSVALKLVEDNLADTLA